MQRARALALLFLLLTLLQPAYSSRYHLLTYSSGPPFDVHARRLANSSTSVGGFDESVVCGPTDLDAIFRARNEAILASRRGSGYWLYKPYILLHYVTQVADRDDVVVYMDSRYEFATDFRATLDEWLAAPPHIALVENKPGRPAFRETEFSKRDAFVLMDVEADRNVTQAWCGFVAVRAGFHSMRYLSEWLTYAQDPRILTDVASVFGPEGPDFRENRHDQTVCSLLRLKWQLPLRHLALGPIHNWQMPPLPGIKRQRRREA